MHVPVLYQPIISFLRPNAGCRLVDCTVGGGGHAYGLLQASQPDGRLLGLDLDPQALSHATRHLSIFGERVILKRASYEDLTIQLEEIGWQAVDGILLDLGISSLQLDAAEKGFSFLKEASLDMRFDPDSSLRADDLVNGLPENELADLIYRYGEERYSRKIARAIVNHRPIHSTRQLADLVVISTPHSKDGIHPATRTFQALRIAVNHELDAIQNVLPQAVSSLASGGRLAVISFHSLEDRIVKRYFQQESRDCICPPDQPVCTCGHKARLVLITRKPVRPTAEEIERNPRARSAKLRVAEKIDR